LKNFDNVNYFNFDTLNILTSLKSNINQNYDFLDFLISNHFLIVNNDNNLNLNSININIENKNIENKNIENKNTKNIENNNYTIDLNKILNELKGFETVLKIDMVSNINEMTLMINEFLNCYNGLFKNNDHCFDYLLEKKSYLENVKFELLDRLSVLESFESDLRCFFLFDYDSDFLDSFNKFIVSFEKSLNKLKIKNKLKF
jgi:hypothetical protein